jgi:hypothetical protein
MNKFFPTLGLGLILFVPCLAQAEDAPVKPVVVPFELLPTGHMTVMVKVNDKGPYKVIFDTGAPMILFNNKLALDAGIIKEKKAGFFGNQGAVKVKSLEVGSRKADNVLAVVLDHPTVEAISKAYGPIDGIIGFPFFARYTMTLDYQAKTLTFVPNGYDPPDVMKGMEAVLTDMISGKPKPPLVLAPAAQWGLVTAKAAQDDEPGVDIKMVLPASPAAAAGLNPGDRLLTLDGRWTDSVADVYAAAGYVKPGTTVPVKVLRDGKELVLKVKPTSGL